MWNFVNSPVFATLSRPSISASLRAEIWGNSEQIGGPLATLSAKEKRLKALGVKPVWEWEAA
jgi:hypothetical protein